MYQLIHLIHAALSGRQQGQGLMEYGLIVALISVAAVGSMLILGPSIGSLMSTIMDSVSGSV